MLWTSLFLRMGGLDRVKVVMTSSAAFRRVDELPSLNGCRLRIRVRRQVSVIMLMDTRPWYGTFAIVSEWCELECTGGELFFRGRTAPMRFREDLCPSCLLKEIQVL